MKKEINITESKFKKSSKKLKNELELLSLNISLTESKELLSRILKNTTYHELNKFFNNKETKKNELLSVESELDSILKKIAIIKDYSNFNTIIFENINGKSNISLKLITKKEDNFTKENINILKKVDYDMLSVIRYLYHCLTSESAFSLDINKSQKGTIIFNKEKYPIIKKIIFPKFNRSNYSPFEKIEKDEEYKMYFYSLPNENKNSYTVILSEFDDIPLSEYEKIIE